MTDSSPYAARLEIDYPEAPDRLTTFFRLVWILPIAVILGLLSGAGETVVETVIVDTAGEVLERSKETAEGLASGLVAATALMIVFRRRYPRWWFDFSRELIRFAYRVGAYGFLLTDRYPSTVDEQSVHLDVDYPDAEADLDRLLPLVKWLLAFPHYLVLVVLIVAAAVAAIGAWFSILLTGRYPRGAFDFIVGVGRWQLRVDAYAFLLVTDRYPPFSLRAE
jgi:hypothetical protein